MTFLLTRTESGPDGTLGALTRDGAFVCHTLEPDEDRSQHPAIPLGTYKIVVSYSTRFRRMLPLVLNVPGRLGIRIHSGNFEHDTDGCILLGMGRTGQVLTDSRTACEVFQSAIAPCLAKDVPVTLQIIEGRKDT